MSGLQDAALPPGAIVATHEDDETLEEGQVRRNDGVVLNPASKNPWYVLATVAGEQEDFSINEELHAQNRRFWNGWMCQGMSAGERVALAEKLELDVEELSPLSEDEKLSLYKCFAKVFPHFSQDDLLPHSSNSVDMSETYFRNTLALGKYHFPCKTFFDTSCFTGLTDLESINFSKIAFFSESHFSEITFFRNAYFEGPAEFQSAYFNKYVIFQSAHFFGYASFDSGHFDDSAYFQKSRFAEVTSFETVYFGGKTDFSDSTFQAATNFQGAKFANEVPKFFQCEINQDTRFSDRSILWPLVNRGNARAGKQAYTRLRQIAVGVANPDREHFFLRQEMRCKEVLAGHFEKVLFILYRKMADSGISVARPFAVLMILWALGAAMFAGYFLAPMGHEIPDSAVASPGLSGIGLSFANVFAFLGLSRAFFGDVLASLPISLKYFAGIQTVFGAVFFILLALGLRNRFRLK